MKTTADRRQPTADGFTDLLGVPWKLGGRSFTGLDCWGLCLEVGRRAGIELPETDSPGSMDEVPGAFAEGRTDFADHFIRVPGPEPYAVVAFRLRGKFVTHVGMVLEDKEKFIHIIQGRNVAIERLDHPLWKKAREGFYRWKKPQVSIP